jgi:hypothetical protein
MRVEDGDQDCVASRWTGAFKPNKQAFLSLIFTHSVLLAESCVSTACL